jgi:hypothetical protein
MRKMKKWITGSIVLSVLVIGMTSTAVLADNTSERIAINPLIARVASILGISETELVGAFTTAISEMRSEKLEEKLTENIANGNITEEEAQVKRERFDQKLDRKGDRLGLEHFKPRHHVHHFKSFTIPGEPRLITPEELESKMASAIESGVISEEQAQSKRDRLQEKINASIA